MKRSSVQLIEKNDLFNGLGMNVLILTTRNAARSQMIEGWLRYYLKGKADVCSAGLEQSVLDPFAVKAMMEAVIDIRGQKAKVLNDLESLKFDSVFALTGKAFEKANELFPEANVEMVEIADPSLGGGDDMERLKVYRKTVDEVDNFAFSIRARFIQS